MEQLLALVYEDLRALAGRRMSGERADHSLDATSLAHEAYVRLVGDAEHMSWSDRRHFFGAAAQAMRRILVDHARRTGAEKRGGDRVRVTLGAAEDVATYDDERVLALHDALEQLESEDERAAEVTRLRFFAGLSMAEIAGALDASERTIAREWSYARARLTELIRDAADG